MKKSDLVLKLVEMTNLPKKVIEKVIEIRENDKKISYENISKKIKRELDLEFSKDEVKKIWDESRMLLKGISNNIEDIYVGLELDAKKELEEFNNAVEHKNKREEDEEENYIVIHKNKVTKKQQRFVFTCELVDKACGMYSEHGLNLSGTEVQQQLNLTATAWEVLKYSIPLTKKSHILGPITMRKAEQSGNIEEVIENAVVKNYEDKYTAIYNRADRNKTKSDLAKFAKSVRGYGILLDMLEERLRDYEPRALDFSNIPQIANDNILDAFLTDIHLGAKGTSDIRDRITEFTNDLIKHKARKITISFGGDAGELFVPYGEMHPGQRLGMEDMTTADLIMLVLEVFEEMLVALVKAGKEVQFNLMKGNHDRGTEKKEYDPHRTPAEIVGRLLQKILKDVDIKIRTFQEKATVVRSGNIKYIFLHGDGFAEKELYKRVLKQREEGCYIVVVTGDKHHFKMLEINDEILRIQSPAMANKGQFADSLGLSSLPGALLFERNAYGNMDFTVKRYARSSIDDELNDEFFEE